MPKSSKALHVTDFVNTIENSINEIVAQNNHFGIGAPPPEKVEENLEKIRRLEAQLAHLKILRGL